MLTNNPIPQLGFGGKLADGIYLLDKLDGLHQELGFAQYTEGSKGVWDVFCITGALMVGTAGLPHVIVRFFTVPKVADARKSAGWALLFIAILYTTAPAIAVFARTNLINTVSEKKYSVSEEITEMRWSLSLRRCRAEVIPAMPFPMMTIRFI